MNLDLLKQYETEGLLYSQVHPTLPLTIWNYTDKSQWESLWNEITLSCRGLVTDDLGNVVARPFRKFFNLSEGKTNVTDSYEIFEKLDGSLGILFFYGENWTFASRGSFNSDQAIKGKELLDKVCNYELLNKNNTYCFEIIYPENKIVVEYEGFEGVVLTAVFDTKTGEEKSMYEYDLLTALAFDSETPLKDLHDTIKDNEEGYVVRFSNGERCKIKGAEYLRLHKMMSEMSTTAVWDCLRNGDSILSLLEGYPDEFFDVVAQYEQELINEFKDINSQVWEKYLKIGKIDSDKEFADIVKDYKYKHILFSLRNGKRIDEQIYRIIKPEYRRL
jgi:RNA ligase